MFGLPNPYLIGGVALAFALSIGWALWERHDAVAYKAERDAKTLESSLHEADATRWQTAAEARLQQIVGLSDQMTRQNADVKAAADARDRAERRAAGAATQAAEAQAALNDLTLKWKERGNAHPEDIRPLGPVACDAYRSLYGATAACTHPNSAASN